MTELDRDAFKFKAIFPALDIDVSWLNILMRVMDNVRFKHKRIDTLLHVGGEMGAEGKEGETTDDKNDNSSSSSSQSSRRLMLLDPETAPDFPSLVTALNSKASCLDQYKITESNFKYQLIHFQYENFNPETVRDTLLICFTSR